MYKDKTKTNLNIFLILVQAVKVDTDPCNPSPCGPNAECNRGSCTCYSNYFGDAYSGCRPECVLNSDCDRTKTCSNQRCIDPCPGTCGQDARCDVINHIPTCSCPERTSGDPFVVCRPFREPVGEYCLIFFLQKEQHLHVLTLNFNAKYLYLQKHHVTYVLHHPAALTVNVAKLTTMQFALASLASLVHHPRADLSAW